MTTMTRFHWPSTTEERTFFSVSCIEIKKKGEERKRKEKSRGNHDTIVFSDTATRQEAISLLFHGRFRSTNSHVRVHTDM